MLLCLGSFLKVDFFHFHRHISSFLSMFKLLVIGVIIIGRDPFAFFGMQAPGIWEWGQGNKVRFTRINQYDCDSQLYLCVTTKMSLDVVMM